MYLFLLLSACARAQIARRGAERDLQCQPWIVQVVYCFEITGTRGFLQE